MLSRHEMQRIEELASRERDKLIVRILADTGIRLGELLGLRPASVIDRDGRHYLHVSGKGQRDRLVPITPILHERLARYVVVTGPIHSGSDILFLAARRSHAGRFEPLAAQASAR